MRHSSAYSASGRFHAYAALALLAFATSAGAQTRKTEERLDEAAAVLQQFTADEDEAIPAELLERARGLAVIPGVLRGGFIFGGRRGHGVLIVRSERGDWSNPGFITLTGGSIGGQIGMESTDLVLVFANDNAVKNMSSGKFTLGGDASAVAGPLGRHVTGAVTFKAEVYIYSRSRGLFAGASFEGARLSIDDEANAELYSSDTAARALGDQGFDTPAGARRFLLTVEPLTRPAQAPAKLRPDEPDEGSEARTFPLE